MYKVLSSYQQLGATALSSISASWRQASIHDIHSLLHWFLLDVPVVPVLLSFHVLFAATQTAAPSPARHFWFKSLVLTIFAAFGGSTLAAVFSGAPPPLFTNGSNFMLGYCFVAWYLVHTLPPLRAVLSWRLIKALLAFGAMAAKSRSIFAFVDRFVIAFPRAAAGAIVLGGVAGSGGSLFVAFERKLRLGAAAPSQLSRPGWGFKSAYLAAALYYIATDPDHVLRDAALPLRAVIHRDHARFAIALALCSHAFVEALIGRHVNPLYALESVFYAVARLERSDAMRRDTPARSKSKNGTAGDSVTSSVTRASDVRHGTPSTMRKPRRASNGEQQMSGRSSSTRRKTNNR